MAIRIMHVVDSLCVGGWENGLVNLVARMDHGEFEHVVCAVRSLGAMAQLGQPDHARAGPCRLAATFVHLLSAAASTVWDVPERLRHFFSLNSEANPGAWFSAL